ncbi:MAG: hypothetical protein ACXWLX_00840 [Rhizomicrobium sp.]
MSTRELATAQILFILVSDSRPQQLELTRDLQRSRYRYCFTKHADKNTLVKSVMQQINTNFGRLPVVLVVNYKFARKDSYSLLEFVQRARRFSAIECIVTHPPSTQKARDDLLALGAKMFDGQEDLAFSELTLH